LTARILLNQAVNAGFVLVCLGGIVVLLCLRIEPANWIFLVCETLLLAVGLGELDRPGKQESESQEEQAKSPEVTESAQGEPAAAVLSAGS
jgi:hypothetical protein